jgi:MFS family permease
MILADLEEGHNASKPSIATRTSAMTMSTATLIPEVCDGPFLGPSIMSLAEGEDEQLEGLVSQLEGLVSQLESQVSQQSLAAAPAAVPLPANPYVYGGLVALLTFASGFNNGSIAAALISLDEAWGLRLDASALTETLIVSSMLVGAAVGAGVLALGGMWFDRFGRLPILLLAALLLSGGAFASAWTSTADPMVAARFVTGLGIGLATTVPGLYLTEMSPASVRGFLGILNQCAGYGGVAASYFVGYLVCRDAEARDVLSAAYRRMFLAGGWIAAGAGVAIALVLPESPRWLISVGRDRDALVSLRAIYGAANALHFTDEFAAIYARLSQTAASTTMRALESASLRRAARIALLLQVFQQAAGSGFVTYYSAEIFKGAGLAGAAAVLVAAASTLPQLAVFWMVAQWSETWGRKKMLLVSEAAMALVLVFLAAVVVFLPPGHASPLAGLLMFLGLSGHRVAYAIGLAPVPSVLVGEILPFAHRCRGLAAASALSWLLSLVFSSVLPLLLFHRLAFGFAFLAMAACAGFGFFWITGAVAETRGVPLECANDTHLVPVLPADPSERARFARAGSLLAASSKPLQPPPIPVLTENSLHVPRPT